MRVVMMVLIMTPLQTCGLWWLWCSMLLVVVAAIAEVIGTKK